MFESLIKLSTKQKVIFSVNLIVGSVFLAIVPIGEDFYIKIIVCIIFNIINYYGFLFLIRNLKDKFRISDRVILIIIWFFSVVFLVALVCVFPTVIDSIVFDDIGLFSAIYGALILAGLGAVIFFPFWIVLAILNIVFLMKFSTRDTKK